MQNNSNHIHLSIFARFRRKFAHLFYKAFPPPADVLARVSSYSLESEINPLVKLYEVYRIAYSTIGAYTYVSPMSGISYADIGKFCSIGPNFLCGWGIHPVDKLSTAPMFYSTMRQNGMTFSVSDKIQERKRIRIGNDVFIGANVTVLDGVTIGDGAIIGACSLVNKDIPPYAVVGGIPAKVIRYRFSPEQIQALLDIRWWDFSDEKLSEIEQYFLKVDEFILKYGNKQ